MASKQWKHYCDVEKREVFLLVEICPKCHTRGERAGFRLSVIEHMASYGRRTTLPSVGDHRPFADTLFDPFFKKCPNCDGEGLVDMPLDNQKDGRDYDICPVCKFGRYIFVGTPEELDAIQKQVRTVYTLEENTTENTVTDHRSKYTYLLQWWQKRGGTFRVRTDGIELRAISHPSQTLGVLFIESPYVASVILDWELKDLGLKVRDVKKFQRSIPRPEQFLVVRGSAYLPIDDSFTQPMFDQLLDALADLDKLIKPNLK